MDLSRRPSFYGLSLLVGALLVAGAGVVHPRLAGDGAAQLGVIAATPAWRAIHWTLLFGVTLVLAGLIGGLLQRHAANAGAVPARPGAFLTAFGYGALAVNILFMTGAGGALADAYTRSDLGLTATRAVFVFDMLHPFGLAAARVGAFAIGLGTYLFGWAVVSGGVLPRWLGWAGVGAGAAGAVLALVVNETAPQVLGGVALATVWQVLVAVALVRERPAAA